MVGVSARLSGPRLLCISSLIGMAGLQPLLHQAFASRLHILPVQAAPVPASSALQPRYTLPRYLHGGAAQVVFAVSYFALPPEFTGIFEDAERVVKNWHLFFCVACGLWGGLIIGIATEYFTSNRYQPVQVGLQDLIAVKPSAQGILACTAAW